MLVCEMFQHNMDTRRPILPASDALLIIDADVSSFCQWCFTFCFIYNIIVVPSIMCLL